jgi:hypothetical protein
LQVPLEPAARGLPRRVPAGGGRAP